MTLREYSERYRYVRKYVKALLTISFRDKDQKHFAIIFIIDTNTGVISWSNIKIFNPCSYYQKELFDILFNNKCYTKETLIELNKNINDENQKSDYEVITDNNYLKYHGSIKRIGFNNFKKVISLTIHLGLYNKDCKLIYEDIENNIYTYNNKRYYIFTKEELDEYTLLHNEVKNHNKIFLEGYKKTFYLFTTNY